MTFKFLNRRSDIGIDDRDLGQDMVLKVPWCADEGDEYPVPMNEDERAGAHSHGEGPGQQ